MKFTVTFEVPARIIYQTLTQEREYMAFTRAPARFDPQGEFVLYEGQISGRVLELREPNLIKLQWQMRDWPTASEVQISISDIDDDECSVTVLHTGIPPRNNSGQGIDEAEIENGWRGMIFQKIGDILGYKYNA